MPTPKLLKIISDLGIDLSHVEESSTEIPQFKIQKTVKTGKKGKRGKKVKEIIVDFDKTKEPYASLIAKKQQIQRIHSAP